MRLDKYLKLSRIIKRRTVAQEVCGGGRVDVNGRSVKSAYTIKIGDIVTVSFGDKKIKFRVLSDDEKAARNEPSSLYEVING